MALKIVTRAKDMPEAKKTLEVMPIQNGREPVTFTFIHTNITSWDLLRWARIESGNLPGCVIFYSYLKASTGFALAALSI